MKKLLLVLFLLCTSLNLQADELTELSGKLKTLDSNLVKLKGALKGLIPLTTSEIAQQKKEQQEKLEQEKLEREKLEQEKLEQERLEQEKLEQEKLEQEKLEREKLEREKLEREKTLLDEKVKQEAPESQSKLISNVVSKAYVLQQEIDTNPIQELIILNQHARVTQIAAAYSDSFDSFKTLVEKFPQNRESVWRGALESAAQIAFVFKNNQAIEFLKSRNFTVDSVKSDDDIKLYHEFLIQQEEIIQEVKAHSVPGEGLVQENITSFIDSFNDENIIDPVLEIDDGGSMKRIHNALRFMFAFQIVGSNEKKIKSFKKLWDLLKKSNDSKRLLVRSKNLLDSALFFGSSANILHLNKYKSDFLFSDEAIIYRINSDMTGGFKKALIGYFNKNKEKYTSPKVKFAIKSLSDKSGVELTSEDRAELGDYKLPDKKACKEYENKLKEQLDLIKKAFVFYEKEIAGD